MNFREFYNPKKVYDGYFETYFIRPFYHHYADFRGHESAKSLVLSLVAWFTVTLGIAGVLMGQVGLLGPEVGFSCLTVIGCIWVAISLVPLAALFLRKANGLPEKPIKARFLGIDTMLAVSCLLFFLLGLLMMVTTLNSGSLDPNARMTDEEDSSSIQLEEIREEPIFTYQDETPAAQLPDADTLGDMTDPDMVDPDESFDPTIKQPADDLIESPDSITMF